MHVFYWGRLNIRYNVSDTGNVSGNPRDLLFELRIGENPRYDDTAFVVSDVQNDVAGLRRGYQGRLDSSRYRKLTESLLGFFGCLKLLTLTAAVITCTAISGLIRVVLSTKS